MVHNRPSSKPLLTKTMLCQAILTSLGLTFLFKRPVKNRSRPPPYPAASATTVTPDRFVTFTTLPPPFPIPLQPPSQLPSPFSLPLRVPVPVPLPFWFGPDSHLDVVHSRYGHHTAQGTADQIVRTLHLGANLLRLHLRVTFHINHET